MLLNHFFYTYYKKKKIREKKEEACKLVLFSCRFSHDTETHIIPVDAVPRGWGCLWSQAACGSSVPACSHELLKALSQALSHTACPGHQGKSYQGLETL